MNVFELACVASPIVGAVVGVTYHAVLGVGQILGGFIGAALGIVAYFALVFALAVICKMAFRGPLIKPKKGRR